MVAFSGCWEQIVLPLILFDPKELHILRSSQLEVVFIFIICKPTCGSAVAMWWMLKWLCGGCSSGYVVDAAVAMWWMLQQLCGGCCSGYVVDAAVAMWWMLQRLCGVYRCLFSVHYN